MSQLVMPKVNKLFLCGRLTADPVVKHTQNNQPFIRACIAWNDGYENSATGFLNIVIWYNVENLITKLKQGTPVYVEGPIKYNTYVKDGVKHTSYEMSCTHCQSLEKIEKNN